MASVLDTEQLSIATLQGTWSKLTQLASSPQGTESHTSRPTVIKLFESENVPKWINHIRDFIETCLYSNY